MRIKSFLYVALLKAIPLVARADLIVPMHLATEHGIGKNRPSYRLSGTASYLSRPWKGFC